MIPEWYLSGWPEKCPSGCSSASPFRMPLSSLLCQGCRPRCPFGGPVSSLPGRGRSSGCSSGAPFIAPAPRMLSGCPSGCPYHRSWSQDACAMPVRMPLSSPLGQRCFSASPLRTRLPSLLGQRCPSGCTSGSACHRSWATLAPRRRLAKWREAGYKSTNHRLPQTCR